MIDVQEEQRLQALLTDLRFQVKKRTRKLFIWLLGVFGSFLLVIVSMPARHGHLSFVDAFGVFPVVLFFVFGTAAIIAGWKVGEAENRVRAVTTEIQSLYECE